MKKIFITICFFQLTFFAMAQDDYFYVSLDVNKPMTNTDWVGDMSARGIKAGFRKNIAEQFSAGLDFSSAAFDRYNPRETFQNTGGAITTDYFNYLYSYAATGVAQYTFKVGDGNSVLPYVGLGLGAKYNEYVVYYNIYTDRDKSWGFLARPEAGIVLQRRNIGAIAAVHYDFSTNASEMFEYNNFSAIGFQVGIVFFSRY
jgi:hypothetical protein